MKLLKFIWCGIVGHRKGTFEGYESDEKNEGCNTYAWTECMRCSKRLSEPEFSGHSGESLNSSLPALPNGWRIYDR